MKTLEVESLHGISICHSTTMSCRETFAPLTYRFEAGKVYCITTKRHNSLASWALACALGGRMEEDYQGKLIIDEVPADLQVLQKKACFVADDRALLPEHVITNQFNIYNFDYDRYLISEYLDSPCASAKDFIEMALSKTKSNLTIENIKSRFELSDERFDRDIRFVSNEIWQISIAIGYAEERSVFIFPLIDSKNANTLNRLNSIIEELKHNKKTVIIPVMNKEDICIKYDAILYTSI